jgi:hypothetical protein
MQDRVAMVKLALDSSDWVACDEWVLLSPQTLTPNPQILVPKPQPPNPQILVPKPQTLDPTPRTSKPRPQTPLSCL